MEEIKLKRNEYNGIHSIFSINANIVLSVTDTEGKSLKYSFNIPNKELDVLCCDCEEIYVLFK